MNISEIMNMGAAQLRHELSARNLPSIGSLNDLRASLIGALQQSSIVEQPQATPQAAPEVKPERVQVLPTDQRDARATESVSITSMQPVDSTPAPEVRGRRELETIIDDPQDSVVEPLKPIGELTLGELADDPRLAIFKVLSAEFDRRSTPVALQRRIVATLASGGTVVQQTKLARFFDSPLTPKSRQAHLTNYGKTLEFFWNDTLSEANSRQQAGSA